MNRRVSECLSAVRPLLADVMKCRPVFRPGARVRWWEHPHGGGSPCFWAKAETQGRFCPQTCCWKEVPQWAGKGWG